ncbi:GH3 auxin-responsive promoter family protein [Microbulbifer sp. TYP-18]|uniref:GH3 family domain-containing protein n=1 Tax=Microbulbifer sp. TYP-18 TaxID=3230024 RepID=UPI0034C61BB4
MLLGFAGFSGLAAAGLSATAASTGAAGGALLCVLLLERVIPLRGDWQPSISDLKIDAVFMLVVQVMLPRGLALALSIALATWAGASAAVPSFLWPHGSPVWVQLLLMVAIADLLRYWLHVACHKIPLLWRFHAVHHETEKLYALSVARFHPLEKSMQYLLDTAPFALLAVEPQVLAAYFLFYATNGFFQHGNLDIRLGPLNHLISGGELHRWHHHVDPQAAQVNFGNNLIIWDSVFGTRYLPTNREHRTPDAVGIRNHPNPYRFDTGIIRAWLCHRVITPCGNLLLNTGLKLRIWLTGKRLWAPFLADLKQPEVAQWKLLNRILQHNRNTQIGREFDFAQIRSYADFKRQVPLQTYDTLEPYIRRQREAGTPCVTADRPIIYAKTSGTTGAAKFIPVGNTALAMLKASQELAGYCIYQACPEAYRGKLLTITSPSVEGYLPGGAAYGSTSGLVAQSMSRLAQKKYVLPRELFDIEDHQIRYREILRISLCEKHISCLGTANPSTLLMLLEILNEQRWELLDAVRGKTRTGLLPAYIEKAIQKKGLARESRIAELQTLFSTRPKLGFNDIWPGLKLVVTWTGGSCGIPIKNLRQTMSPDTHLMDLGYIATELRGTVTATAGTGQNKDRCYRQLPCLQQNFFEFVERSDWEANSSEGKEKYLLLHQLQEEQQYYVIVTNFNGLYRYFMNDIVQVDGRFEQTPSLNFIQKGRGVTNITGEKLSEQQVLQAVADCERAFDLSARFFLMLADEERSHYRLLLEAGDPIRAWDDPEPRLAKYLDEALSSHNIEYRCKRASGRLGSVHVQFLSPGTWKHYRRALLDAGQRESQLKYLCLQYMRENRFNFGDHYLLAAGE